MTHNSFLSADFIMADKISQRYQSSDIPFSNFTNQQSHQTATVILHAT